MKPRYPRLAAALVAAGLSFASLAAAPLRVLFFTKSSGYEHSAIKRVDGKPSHAENVLSVLGPKEGIEFTFTKDGSLITADYLKQFDALLFYTSGDLCSVGGDGAPAMTPAGKQALFDYVAAGGGFVGVHSTSDTFHTNEHGPGNPAQRRLRYQNYGDAADPYVRFLGAEFIRHGPQQVARATVVDPKFPGFGAIGAELNVKEEWYTLKDFSADLHVLLVMQTAGMEGGDYLRPPYPLAWARSYGKGRVGYNAMGHREDIWDGAPFQSMLVGMLKWAAHRADADLAPNLMTAAPGALTLQVPPADVK